MSEALTPEEREARRKELAAKEFSEWLQLPQTKQLWWLLLRWKEDLKEQWASGKFTDASNVATAMLNAAAIGKCEILDRVREITFDQLESEVEDERSKDT